jgi:hypothetical protein
MSREDDRTAAEEAPSGARVAALRWSALTAVAGGVGLMLAQLRTVGLVVAGVGIVLAIVERALAPAAAETLEGRRVARGGADAEAGDGAGDEAPRAPDEATVPGGTPLKVLGWGSFALLLLGLGLVARDVFAQEQTGNQWLPLVAGAVGLVVTAAWDAVASPARRPTVVLPPRSPRRRRLVYAGVAALMLAQAVIPLRYYLGDDRFDERFSWRMFSAVRVYRCQLRAFETAGGVERPKRLMSTIHVGWITTMRRNREAVMRRYLRWRCEQEGVEGARLVNRCVTPEGNRVPDVVRAIDCGTGAIISQGGER